MWATTGCSASTVNTSDGALAETSPGWRHLGVFRLLRYRSY